MKISLDWISDFVDLADLAPERIADQLTIATAEVEGFETLQRFVAGVLVGEVTALEPLTDKLHAATVDCGTRKYATVCGAPNIRVGMKAPFAPAGTQLAGAKIEATEMAGRRSEGVLCSAAELGLSRWHEVLLECPASIANGTPLAELIPERDVIVEIDNKSLTHRPDLWGHYGIARELAAVFRRPLRPLPMTDLARFERLPAYPLTLDDRDGCPCYGCLEFNVAASAASPLVIQRRLHALGQRTFGLLVDLTNYAMWELAQPTHAFDGDLLKAVRVATLGKPGKFTTLDGQERDMLADDLLIWNEREPVALAGIMGGLHSEVRPTTQKVLLESANFKASRIRRTSVRLDLRSESAQRFEKSQPPANVRLGIARILRLVEEAGARPEVTTRFTVAGDMKESYRPLAVPRKTLVSMAGKEIPDEEAQGILTALGFQARFDRDSLQVGIPPHRSEKDISIPADVVEEVLRVYGYGRIEPKMPALAISPVHVEKPLRLEHKARRLLAEGHGFIEVHNYGWFDENWLGEIGYSPTAALELKNPAAQQNRFLRTTLVPNLLALVRPNRVHRDAFRLFEIGRVYHQQDGKAVERSRLAGLSFHQVDFPPLEEHFREVKGAIEDLARMLGCGPFAFHSSASSTAPWEVPAYWATIELGGKPLGGIGVLAGPILEKVAIDGQVVWFDLAIDAIDGQIFPELKYAPPPIYPGSWQDFSLVWDVAQGFTALEQRLNKFSHALVLDREFLTVYKGKGLPPGQGSYSFRYWIGARDHTLSAEEIEQFRAALLAFLQAESIALR